MNTDSYLVVALYLHNLLLTNASGGTAPTPALASWLQKENLYFGDQTNLPRTPTVCIDPGGKVRELQGAPRRYMTTMANYIIVYHNPVQSTQTTRLELDTYAEDVETLIHTDAQMQGGVIDSYVRSIESGYLQRRNTLFRASRLTIEARSIVQLPSTV